MPDEIVDVWSCILTVVKFHTVGLQHLDDIVDVCLISGPDLSPRDAEAESSDLEGFLFFMVPACWLSRKPEKHPAGPHTCVPTAAWHAQV